MAQPSYTRLSWNAALMVVTALNLPECRSLLKLMKGAQGYQRTERKHCSMCQSMGLIMPTLWSCSAVLKQPYRASLEHLASTTGSTPSKEQMPDVTTDMVGP